LADSDSSIRAEQIDGARSVMQAHALDGLASASAVLDDAGLGSSGPKRRRQSTRWC